MGSQLIDICLMSGYMDQALDEIRESLVMDEESFREGSFCRMRGKMIVLLAGLTAHPSFGSILEQLRTHDEYTFRHSIGVALIARWIAEANGVRGLELQMLTEAALLHDAGKIRLPVEILNKPGSLTEEEFSLIREHCESGHEIILSAERTAERYANIALQHHEREDGSGYPFNRTGQAIDPWSKIIAVADVFHAMISKRAYKAPVSALKVLQAMSEERFGALAPDSVYALQRKVMTLMIGCNIRLSNGALGRIVLIPCHDPLHPVVEVGGKLIELSKRQDLEIDCIMN